MNKDIDPQETREWLASLASVLREEGEERAHFILETLLEQAARDGLGFESGFTTPYYNTIPVERQPSYPGNLELEKRIEAYVRWNALAMVIRAGKHTNVGGHIASFASSAVMYEVGQNHFWHGQEGEQGGDLVFFQGHCAPGMYARAFLEGRLTEEQLDNYRQEVGGNGLSSYPHPWLMPHFWQFPTVSMGLGPMMALYQARFMRYMESRGLIKHTGRKVWAFLGDGEMDEPESRGQIALAAREHLDNLVFVVNCNLQRLDGPVRGSGKIVQELEGEFRGAGWNVIKVMWDSKWDKLFARDVDGVLRKRMMEVNDGDYQTYKSKNGAYIREHFFNSLELKALVADMTDEEIWDLQRGGHDPLKVFAAYKAAQESSVPTLILMHTVKGWAMGGSAESQNVAHQSKKMDLQQLLAFRDRFNLPLTHEQVEKVEYLKFPEGSPEQNYLLERREKLQGFLPERHDRAASLPAPSLESFASITAATKEGREISTTMAFVRVLSALMKDKALGKHIVPIVPDEFRTFGMEGMFRQYGIWNPLGQQYTPSDADQLMFYKEAADGQILQEGINEAGAMCDWIAAATSYSVNGVAMIPFLIYYSMFGFQRFGDFAWAAGDQRARGFLLGGTAGRTTLNGEGLQHEDVYYYMTLLNENYAHPEMPEGSEHGILKGLHQIGEHKGSKGHVQLMGSGSILQEVIAGAKLLADEWGIGSDIWSATSFTLLAREAADVERYNRLHPTGKPRTAYLNEVLAGKEGPIVVSTDYIRAYPDQIRAYLPKERDMLVLGTDGFGRSDTREALRRHFEVNRYHVVIAALKSLADQGKVQAADVQKAIEKYGIDTEGKYPLYR